MDFRLKATCANVSAENYKTLMVDLEGVDKDEYIELISISDFLEFFGQDKILDYIGENECKEYFHLIDRV